MKDLLFATQKLSCDNFIPDLVSSLLFYVEYLSIQETHGSIVQGAHLQSFTEYPFHAGLAKLVKWP